MGTPIVLDVNVLVDAALPHSNPAAGPHSDAASDALLVINHGDHSSLWLSEHIVENVYRVLVEKAGLDQTLAEEYIHLLEDIATQTHGVMVDEPPRTAFQVAAEHEDDLILDLVDHSGAPFLITSNTKDFPAIYRDRAMVKTPPEFVKLYEQTRIARLAAAQRSSSRPSTKSRFDQIRAQISGEPSPLGNSDELDRYDDALEQFDQKKAQLQNIVKQWNPANPAMAKRIETWNDNFEKLQQRADEAEAHALLDPARATAVLSALNKRMDYAMSRLGPRSHGTKTPMARSARPSSTMSSHPNVPSPASENDAQPEF